MESMGIGIIKERECLENCFELWNQAAIRVIIRSITSITRNRKEVLV